MKIIALNVVFMFLFICPGNAQEDPFKVTPNRNSWDISSLTCEQFATLIHNKSPQLFPITIWLHGLASGLDRKTEPFYADHNGSLLVLAATLCGRESNKQKTVFSEFLKIKSKH